MFSETFFVDFNRVKFLFQKGSDALDLLDRLSTNSVLELSEKGIKTTIVTDEKAKIIDVLNVWKINKSGILITHTVALILLFGSAITGFFSQEGQMIIEEGKKSNYIQNIYEKEFTIIKNEGKDSLEVINFHENILTPNNILTHEKLPFQIKIIDFFINSELNPNNENSISNQRKQPAMITP